MKYEKICVSFSAGTDITSAVRGALCEADKYKCAVVFNFNGVEMEIQPRKDKVAYYYNEYSRKLSEL